MLRQIRLLTEIQLCNMGGINEFRHTKDKKKKARFIGMGFAWLIVVLTMLFYVIGLAYGLTFLGMTDLIPAYLFAITSLVIFIFSFFKAGSVLFGMHAFEMIASLPVSNAAIVVSRFLTMYVPDVLLGALILVPGMAVYAVIVQPSFGFYGYGLAGILLLPLLPITAATAVGAAITAISFRMKHKNLMSALLSISLVAGIMVGSMSLTENAESFTPEMFQNLAAIVYEQIGKLYRPALWFGDAVLAGNALWMGVYAAASIALFVLLMAVLQKSFLSVCSALNATSARNNFRMKQLTVSSPGFAFWKKEWKRYFASSIYVTNTMTGYILMALLAASLFFVGTEEMEKVLGMPGVVQKGLPLMLSVVAGMISTTSCSISMEGKSWWIAQTLPIKSKTIFDSKILLNLTIACPFYLLTVLLSLLALKPGFRQGLWIAVLPAVYIVYTAVMGLWVNLKLPVFDWESEMRAVKQSASTFVSLLVGIGSIVPLFICVFVGKNLSFDMIMAAAVVVYLLIAVVVYRRIGKRSLP